MSSSRRRPVALAVLASCLALCAPAAAQPLQAPKPPAPVAAQAGGGIVIQGGPGFKRKVMAALDTIRATQAGVEILQKLEASRNTHKIKQTRARKGSKNTPENRRKASNRMGTGTTTLWEPDGKGRYDADVLRDPTGALFHELVHACDADLGIRDPSVDPASGIKRNEIKATRTENGYRSEKGLPQRQKYGGKRLPPP